MSDIAIQVKGKTFDLWKTVRITRSLETLTGTWEVTAAGPLSLKPGDAVLISLLGQPVCTGYVDDVSWQVEANGQSLTVSGRDRTADLVDCSVVGVRQLTGVTLSALAQHLVKPFKLAVTGPKGGPVFEGFVLQPGETVFSALERAARMRGYLLHTNAQGALVIARPAVTGIASVLTLGGNLLSLVTSVSMRDRFSQYMVQSQALTWTVSHHTTTEKDPEVLRYRPLVITAQEGDDPATRARWTRQVRQARGTRVNATVVGWLNDNTNDKRLWAPNTLVRVVTPEYTTDLLVASVTFIRDESGTRTELECVRPGAYNPEPELPAHKKDAI